MKILHIVGNEINGANGIGRLIPELIYHQNRSQFKLQASLLHVNKRITFQDDCVGIKQKGFICNLKKLKQFDMVVFHGIYFMKYIPLYLLFSLFNTPYLIKPHSSLMKLAQKKSQLKKFVFNHLLFNRFINNSSGLVYTSNDEYESSVHYNVKTYIEPNGIDLPSRIYKSNPNRVINFVYIGRIDFNHKGIDLLLESIKSFNTTSGGRLAIFNIYGNGHPEEEKRLVEYIKESNCTNIYFHGPAFGSAKIDALLNADVFILTSRYEGVPMAILDAMSYNLPCLVTPGTNIGKALITHDAGWLADFDCDSVSSKILNICTTDRSRIVAAGNNARAYVEDFHSWNSVVSKSAAIYKDASI